MDLLCGCSEKSAVYVTADTQASGAADAEMSDESAAGSDTEEEELTASQEERSLCVYVCGAVETPGVYVLAAGSRVCDAIEAAGGFTEDASQDYWNQAEYVSDEQRIDVPTEAEVQAGLVTESAGAADSGTGTEAAASEDSDGKININTATLEELTQISGIGEARAEAIIRYREEHGDFSCIEDIKNVSGIGDGLFEKMQDEIVAD